MSYGLYPVNVMLEMMLCLVYGVYAVSVLCACQCILVCILLICVGVL